MPSRLPFLQRFNERAPFERRVNELTEVRSLQPHGHFFLLTNVAHKKFFTSKGFLLHTKTTGPEMTSKWHETCTRKGFGSNKKCQVGIASPELLGHEANLISASQDGNTASDVFESNCYPHSRVMNEWVPKLEKALLSLNKHYRV